jgi:hypothetical protein
MVTTDPESPRISIMVPCGRKELVKKPALPYRQKHFLVIVRFLRCLPVLDWMHGGGIALPCPNDFSRWGVQSPVCG